MLERNDAQGTIFNDDAHKIIMVNHLVSSHDADTNGIINECLL